MKKRIYFIISSIIGIIGSIVSIITLNTDQIIKEEIEFYNGIFDNKIPDAILESINNVPSYYISLIIGLILFIVILILAIKDKIKIKKGTLIILSILLLLFADTVGLIGIINIIVLLTIKREKVEKKKDEEKFEKLEEPKREKWDIIEGIVVFISYFVLMFGTTFILGKFIKSPSQNFIILINILIDLILLTITLSVYFKELKEQGKIFIKNFKSYIGVILKFYLLVYILNIIGSIIIIIVKGDLVQSVNQETLETLPLYFLILGTLIGAPIIEELVFRGSLRRVIKNDNLYTILSALTFGLIHTVGKEASIFDTFLLALPYMGMGYALAKTYTKTNNLWCNISIHALQNSLAVLIIALS